jgi:alkyldihydroxyacetonephosphate synthase
MFAGGKVETGQGTFNLLEFPASAAGPDMKQLILGSEGRFGVITRATMRVHKLPESERFYGTLFKNWDAGMNAVKETVQRNTQLSMMRLSDPVETEINFRLSGKKQAEFLKERFLPRFGFGNETSLLLFGITGDKKTVHQTRKKARSIFRSHGSSPLIEYLGKSWYRKRFHIPYVRNALWDAGLGLDTLETAVSWSKVNDMTVMVKTAIESAMEKMNQRVLVFFHLSHIYPDGASVYVTYLFKRCQNPDELHCRWQEMKSAASKTIVKLGGTISHQHGVGIDHKPYLQSEKGVLGISAIRAAKTVFDPNSIFNPGKLVD